jgi:thiamine kinase-like enzyme
MIMIMFESSKVVEIFLKYEISKTKDVEKYNLTPLDGITNSTFVVAVDDKKYVLRIPGKNPDEINRESEKYNTSLVQDSGLTLPFKVFDEKSGIKISEYFDIYTYKKTDFNNFELRKNAFNQLKKLHKSGLIFKDNFKPVEVFQNITDITHPLERDASDLGFHIVEQLNNIGMDFMPCHQDLHHGNFVIYNEQTFLIDWEYSSMGDPYFDYADMFWQNEFNHVLNLRNNSLSEIDINTSEQIDKFQYFEILSMITWGLWAMRKFPEDTKGEEVLKKAIKLKKY